MKQQKQEPVAYVGKSQFERLMGCGLVTTSLTVHKAFPDDIALHTSPPQRQPLTDEHIEKLWGEESSCDMPDNLAQFKHTIRVAEAAHGIKDKNT